MAVRKIVPLLTGGAVVTAALAFAYTRRPIRASVPPAREQARFAPEPVGPDDGMVEVLSLAAGPNPSARTEAEAMASAGSPWAHLDNGPASSGEDALRASVRELGVLASLDEVEQEPMLASATPSSTSTSIGSDRFVAVDPGEAFLDLEIEFEDLETPTDPGPAIASDFPRERGESYDAIAPEDLGTEWLARATEAPGDVEETAEESQRLHLERMDTLDDIAEAPTIPATISAARQRLAKADEQPPDSGVPEKSSQS